MSTEYTEATNQPQGPRFEQVPAEHRERIRQLREAKNPGGIGRTARLLGVSELTIMKILGGEKVERATRALIAQGIQQRDAAGKVP